jgi:uncharacterized membrane protein YkvA (DUF1232 family)
MDIMKRIRLQSSSSKRISCFGKTINIVWLKNYLKQGDHMSDNKGFLKRITGSRFFNRAKEQALELTRNPEKLNALLQEADQKAFSTKKGALKEVRDSLMTLFRMLRAYGRGQYRKIPYTSLISIVASVVYFVMPVDFIPDLFLLFGFIDDAALIAWTVKSVKTDIDGFSEWENDQAKIDGATV